MEQAHDFLGIGVGHPFKPDNGKLAWAEYQDSVKQSIQMILGTSKGERVARPDFGCDLNGLVFAPLAVETMTEARVMVEEALLRWEPRIDLDTVTVRPAADRTNCLEIDILYRIKAINSSDNLVYPFFLRGGNDVR